MAKLSQSAIKQKADEWADKCALVRKAETAREAALAPVLAKHDPKIEKLLREADAIKFEILKWLSDRGEPIRLEGEKAVAAYETGTKLGPRVISVKQFLEMAKSKGEAMYECIEILVGRAEKLLGKTELDRISTRTSTPTKDVTLRLKD